jgi:hypothetical protein
LQYRDACGFFRNNTTLEADEPVGETVKDDDGRALVAGPQAGHEPVEGWVARHGRFHAWESLQGFAGLWPGVQDSARG